MAKKADTTQKTEQRTITLEPVKKTRITLDLVGTSDLILNKKSRSFELLEIWKQSHPKGEIPPKELTQEYNLWEKLITSIDWKNPINFHDDNWKKYTEKEWTEYMKKNQPCVSSQAIFGSMYDAFVSFGYKDKTGKNGTDVKRAVSFSSNRYPITFASATYQQKLIPNNTMQHTNVLGQNNIFTGWKIPIEIYTADVAIPAKTVIDLVVTAGSFIGICTQRKNGYGRFTIANVKTEDIKDF